MWRYDPEGRSRSARASARGRAAAGAVGVACLALLIVAGQLHASPAGRGTHTQLGLAPCGFLSATGLPCATCGMTTSFALAADGHLLRAFAVQPFGAMLALAAAAAVLLGLYAAAAGMSLVPLLSPLARSPVLITLAALLLFAWAYKMMLSIGG